VPLHEDKGAVVPFVTKPLPSRQRRRARVASESALLLMIDDTPEDRMAVRLALEAGGFVLQEAADAEHGLKLAASSTPDCILLDYVLPDAEGLEVLESLRQPGGTLPCAVVMLTGAGTADVATAAMNAGALDYLVKDRLDADVLRRAIRSAVRQFRAERRNAQLAAIVAASSDAIISVGTDLAVQTWNAGAQRLFGYSEAEARGRTIIELIVPKVYEAESAAIYAAAMSRRTAVLKQTVRRRKDGRLVPVETNVSPILDGSGGVTGLSVILRDISERRRAEDALRRHAEQQALLLEVTSDLIRASEPGELGRMTFEHVSSAFGAVVCTNYRLDPAGQRLRLVFVHGIPPEYLEAAQSLELGQEYCGTAAASCQPLVADKQRIASDPNGGLVRELGATAYACYPLKASDGRLLGTFAVASATRERFTDDEVVWLGTITNFLAQAWERLEAEQGLRASEERLRLSQEAAGLGHWDFDFAGGTLVWSEQTRKLLGVEPAALASRALLLSRVHAEDRPRLEEHIARSARLDSDHGRHLEFRIVMQNGALRWLEDQSRVETNAAGMPVRAVGVVRDITARKSAEEAQARLAAIVTSSADAIVGKTLDGIVTSWNEAAERMFGYPASEMIGQSIRRLIPTDRQPEEDMILARLARSESIERHEMTLLAKDGRTFDASITVSPMRDAEGRIIGCSKIIRDITLRKRTEARLAEREAQLALFVEHAPAAIAMFDHKMRYLAASRRYVSDFRLPPDVELIGRSHYEIFPDIPPRWREVHARVLAGEELAHEEDPFLRLDGRTDWCRWLMKPWRTADGRIGGALLFSEVITEQVAARRALAESEARFRATFENAAVGIAHLAPDLRWLRANQALSRILGYPVDELVTKSLQDITHPDDLAADLAQIKRTLDGTIDSYDMDKRYLRKDGAIVWGRLTVGGVRKSDGSIDYFVSVVEDISARKRAEELLRRQADLLNQSHDAIFTWKIGGGIAYWSRGAQVLYGYAPGEAIGRSSHELLRTRSPVPVQEIETQIARQGSWYGELTHTTREGRTIVVESRHVRVSYNGETYALETNRDITARKHAEEELCKSEERFRSSLFHSPLPILLFDDREQILALSQSWVEQTGYSREELRRIEDWTARAYGERSGEVLEQIRQIISTEPRAQPAEMMIRTKDGCQRVWSFVSSALGTQSDGRRLFVCMAQDVTERKAHEEQVHLLMREVNHRAKNMLSLVQAIARQTAAREPEDFIGRFTERIQALAANQDLLIRNEWQGVDVQDLVRAQLAHFADLVGSRIAVDGPRLRLNAAAAQAIGLALHELATNAGKYGALSVDAGRVDVGWRFDGDIFAMGWTERNGPPVSRPERRGFGTTVVDSMAKRTVDGEVQLDYAPSGLTWRLTCPAANALERAGIMKLE
jgi:PAS domain S-box-containing protein